MASAWRFVSLAENLQPVLPVQATMPARTCETCAVRPISCNAASTRRLGLRSRMSEMIRFCHGVRRIVPLPKRLGDRREAAHLRGRHASHRKRHAAVERARLLLRDGSPRARRERAAGAARNQSSARRGKGAGRSLLDLGEESVEPHAIEHVLEPRALAIGAIALVDEDAHDRRRHGHALLRCDRHAEVGGEIAVTRDAAHRDAKVDARRNGVAFGARAPP